jgi:meso-butanediol dehydrogenase / (S,S)-butanediol dehydrogenase / diacetyl reductase
VGRNMRLKDRVALITGAGSGIGRAIARRFAAEGAAVVVDDVNDAAGEATVRAIEEAGGRAVYVRGDVSEEGQVSLLIERARSFGGRLDVLVNNAVPDEMSILREEWDRVIGVCLKGPWLLSQAALPALRENRGCIVNIASVNALMAIGKIHLYSAAKAGLLSLTRTLAFEHGPAGVRVNAICPGTIRTEVWEPILRDRPNLMEEIGRHYPLGHVGDPEDVAAMALYLASEEAKFVTGATFVVDGGITAALNTWDAN